MTIPDDVAAGPSWWGALLLATLVAVLVDIAFLVTRAIATAILWVTTPSCSTVTTGGLSWISVVAVAIPAIAVVAAIALPTWVARGMRWYACWIGVLAAVLPASMLVEVLPAVFAAPTATSTWCF